MVTYRWNIFWTNLEPIVGSEQSGARPVIVVSSEAANQRLSLVAVLPITSARASKVVYPTEVFLSSEESGMPKDSLVMAHQIRTIYKQRLLEHCGQVQSDQLRRAILGALHKFIPIA